MAQDLSAMDLYAAHLEHARLIASRSLNIPGVQPSEIYVLASEALWDAAQAFEGRDGNFAAYSTTTIQNRINDLARKQQKYNQRVVSVEPTSQILEQKFSGNQVVDSIAQRESNEALHGILDGLPAREREVLIRSASGESFSQIGKSLGVSKQMVGKISANARESARQSIERSNFEYEGAILRSQGAPFETLHEMELESQRLEAKRRAERGFFGFLRKLFGWIKV